MNLDNVKVSIKDKGHNIKEEGEIIVEEGEILFCEVDIANNKMKDPRQQQGERINMKNKPDFKTIKHNMLTPGKELKLDYSDYLRLESDDSYISHKGEKLFFCTKCHKSFSHAVTLRIHHLSHKPFIYTKCNKEFYTLSELEKQTLVNLGKKVFFRRKCV